MTLAFPEAEFQSRISDLQARIRARGLDVLLVYTPENMYYLTGYQTTGYYVYQCLIVPVDEDPIMMYRETEVTNITLGSVIKRYHPFNDIQSPVEVTCETLKRYSLADKTIGSEQRSYFLTVADQAKTKELLPEVKWVDGDGLVEEGRLIKSHLEIEAMREGARIVARGTEAAYEAARPGVTEAYVASEMVKALIASGSVYFASQPYVTSGYRTGIGHGSWTERGLENNEPVFFELSGNVKRYSTGLMRTIHLGEPSDKARRMAAGSLAGLNAAIEAIKPGAISGDVDRAARDAVANEGCSEYFSHRTGYSIGIGFPPGWGEGHIMDLKSGDPRVLQEGMTFHLVLSLRDPGRLGMGFSETVLVTKDGCEPLTREIPRELFVKQAR